MPVDKTRLKDFFPSGHSISFDEFCRLMRDCPPPTPTAYLQETFRAFDKNADGYISVKEIQQTMKELGEPLTSKQAKEMLKAADLNGDGKLSMEEFRLLFNQLAQSPPVSPSFATNEQTFQFSS